MGVSRRQAGVLLSLGRGCPVCPSCLWGCPSLRVVPPFLLEGVEGPGIKVMTEVVSVLRVLGGER